MAFDKTNSGTLGRNLRKTKPTQPEYTGSTDCLCTSCGAITQFWLSAWVKTAGPNANTPGSKFFSLALTPKDEPAEAPKMKASGEPEDDFDDDIPF
jgi:hypothetical protein